MVWRCSLAEFFFGGGTTLRIGTTHCDSASCFHYCQYHVGSHCHSHYHPHCHCHYPLLSSSVSGHLQPLLFSVVASPSRLACATLCLHLSAQRLPLSRLVLTAKTWGRGRGAMAETRMFLAVTVRSGNMG